MNYSTQKLIFLAATLTAALCTTSAIAQDSCKRKWDEAVSEAKTAKDSFINKDWQQATYTHQRLSSKWDDAAYYCEGKNKSDARQFSDDAKRNGATAQANLDGDKCRTYTGPAGYAYDSANDAMKAQNWPRARDLYQQASEQYRTASRQCDGQEASNAATNAGAAADNARRASENIGIKAKNDKIQACQPARDAAFDLVRQAGDAATAKNFKTAGLLYGRAEAAMLQLAKICQAQSKDDYTVTAGLVQSLKETYTSLAKKKTTTHADTMANTDRTESCASDKESAIDTLKRAKDAGDKEDQKKAASHYGRAEAMFSKLAKTCQDLYEGDFNKFAVMARGLKDSSTRLSKK